MGDDVYPISNVHSWYLVEVMFLHIFALRMPKNLVYRTLSVYRFQNKCTDDGKNQKEYKEIIMRNAARVLAGIIALLFLAFGVRYMFFPEGAMAASGIEAVSLLGMATVRAFIAAGLLSFGILLVMHTVVNQETGALRFAILFLILSIVGRVVSLAADGSDPLAIRNLVPVTLMLIVSIASLVLFLRSEPSVS